VLAHKHPSLLQLGRQRFPAPSLQYQPDSEVKSERCKMLRMARRPDARDAEMLSNEDVPLLMFLPLLAAPSPSQLR